MFCALFVFYFNYYVNVLRIICFLLLLLRWCFVHYLFSSLTITLVFCALFVFYFYYRYFVGVLRTICFLLLLVRWCFAHYLFSTFTIWCFAHNLFSTLTITLVCCALFVFQFNFYAPFVFYFKYYVGVLRTICFLLSPLRWCFAHYLFSTH